MCLTICNKLSAVFRVISSICIAQDALFTSMDFYREEGRTLPPPSECQECEIMIALVQVLK